MKEQPYPLYWPAGHGRTYVPKRSPFALTLHKAILDLLTEIKALKGTNVIVSSNARLKNDGLPYSVQQYIEDPGVAVYFDWKGSRIVFACDKFALVAANVRAIGLTIEAIRGLDRWGVSQIMERTINAAKALPAPARGGRSDDWRVVLDIVDGVDSWARTIEAYEKRRWEAHPDHGGSDEEFVRVQNALDQAKKYFGIINIKP